MLQRLLVTSAAPMNEPRDQHVANRVGIVRTARLFSNVVSPPVMFAILGVLLALQELPIVAALAWSAVYGFFVSLAPILLVLYLLQAGHVAELHMSNTQERHLPYLAAVVGSVLVLGLIILLQGPGTLRCLTLFNVVTLTLISIINRRWLISFHVTSATAMMVIIALAFGFLYGLLLLPLVVALAVTRLYLRRHTVAQIVGGFVLGTASVVLLTPMACFLQG